MSNQYRDFGSLNVKDLRKVPVETSARPNRRSAQKKLMH